MRTIGIAKFVIGLFLLSAVGVLSACNTIGGMGEDVSAVGRGVSSGADQTKEKM